MKSIKPKNFLLKSSQCSFSQWLANTVKNKIVLTITLCFVLGAILPAHASTLNYEIIFNVEELKPRPTDSDPLGFNYLPSIGDSFVANFSVDSNVLESSTPLSSGQHNIGLLTFKAEIAERIWDINQGSIFLNTLSVEIENDQIVEIRGSLRYSIGHRGYDFIDFATDDTGFFSAQSLGTRIEGGAQLRSVPLPGTVLLLMSGLGFLRLFKSKV
ncbi:MAG: hypothetical protein V3V22_01695 [Methylococcales bacterium]